MSMQGQVAVVTGGAKGIGREVALTYARDGAKVAIADVDDERLATTEGELKALNGDRLAVRADVRNEADVQQLMARVAERFGRIDVLANIAGIVPHFRWGVPLWPRIREMDEAQWKRVMDTNLGGTFLCTKHVLPYMEGQRSGHVVNIHGGGGRRACVYVTSKDAIRTFTRFVADEEKEFNVVVVCVSPGEAIATEDAPEEARQNMPGPDVLREPFLLAAQASMDLAGQLVTVKDGKLVVDAMPS